jgi:hypothetical protein
LICFTKYASEPVLNGNQQPELKALQNGMNGEGRGRSTDAQRAEFCTPLWSSSNTSIVHTALELKRLRQIIPLIDRLMELGVPSGCRYFFEGIKTPQQMREFCGQVRKGARTDFGWAGPEFQRRLDAGIKKNEAAARAFVNKRHDVYHEAAEAIVSTSERDLGRISNKFATIYVTGCLASALKILPFSEAEILAAVRTCHRDHVPFIDDQMRAVGMRFDASAGVAPSTSTGKPIASVVKATERPFDRLRRFVNANRKGGFQELEKVGAAGKFVPSAVGYKGKQGRGKNRYTEYLIADATFEDEVGGSDEAKALKHELHMRGLLVTTRRGDGFSYVVKRTLPDGSRPHFVILRHKARPNAR